MDPDRVQAGLRGRDVPALLLALALVAFPLARHTAEVLFIGGAVSAAVVGWPATDPDRVRRLIPHAVVLLALALAAALQNRQLAEVLFVGGVVVAAATAWPTGDPHRVRRLVPHAVLLVGVSVWLVLRVQLPWGPGLHSMDGSTLYPVTLLRYLPFLWAFLLLSLHRFTARDVRLIGGALVLTIPFYAVLVMGQMEFGWQLVWTWELQDTPLLELTVNRGRPGRATGGHPNANTLGLTAWYGLVIASTLMWAARTRRGAGVVTAHMVLAPAAGLSLYLLFQSGSRIAWAVTALAALILVARLPRRVGAAFLVVLVLAGGLVFEAVRDDGALTDTAREVVPEVIWGRIAGSDRMWPSPLSYRMHVWRCGLDLVREHPIAGVGLGEYGPACERRLDDIVPWYEVPPGFLNHAHNLFLQMAAELGIPFTLVVSGWFAWLLWSAAGAVRRAPPGEMRRLRAGMLVLVGGTLLISQINLAVAHDHRLGAMFWIAMAVAVSPLGSAAPTSRSGDPQPEDVRTTA